MLAAPATPALAASSTYTKVLHTYQSQGTIPPCQFTSAQLSTALKGVDTYGAQYFQDFTSAIQNALSARAGGSCARHVSATGAPSPGSGQQPPPGPPPRLGPVTAATDAGFPAPVLGMAVLAGAFALFAAIGGVARTRGWDPHWLASWRHGCAEAGYRIGGGWSALLDRLRARR